MNEVILYTAVSLDGFIAPEDGSLDWLEAPEYQTPEVRQEDFGYGNLLKHTALLAVGRLTYDQIAQQGQWNYPDQETVVFSHQTLSGLPASVTQASGPLVQQVDRWKQDLKGNIWLVGGGVLNGAFLREHLIDRLILTVLPVTLGMGRPLFAHEPRPHHWTLCRQQAWSNSFTQLEYVPR